MESIVPMQDIVVLPFFHLKIGEVHNIFQHSFHLSILLMFNKASIPLREKGGWLNRMYFNLETGDFFGC